MGYSTRRILSQRVANILAVSTNRKVLPERRLRQSKAIDARKEAASNYRGIGEQSLP